MTKRLQELIDLMHAEGGKPTGDALIECVVALDHIAWSARNAKRVLKGRKVGGNLRMLPEFAAWLEYQPFGVIGVIGPWNYPIVTPMGSITYALAAGNTVVFKPSEYTPAIARWYVERFAEVVPEHPVLQAVYGLGSTGRRAGPGRRGQGGVHRLARTGKKIMAACAETLTPVLIEGGGKDAMIVDTDADLELAASSCVWGGMTNAGQTCVGIERVYVAAPVYDAFLAKVVEKAGKLTVGEARGQRHRPDHDARPARRDPAPHRRRARPGRPGGARRSRLGAGPLRTADRAGRRARGQRPRSARRRSARP